MKKKINKIVTIFKKQVVDTFKNKTILIQIIMFPFMAFIMTNSVSISGIPRNYFVLMFASMYIGMAPIICMSTIIAEEKETSTLKTLLMSNVKAHEYLLGVGSCLWGLCFIGAVFFAIIGGFKGKAAAAFLIIMSMGILLSIMIGAIIGIISKNQIMSTSITVPVMMVFSFIPMLSMFNETIKNASDFAYTQQIYNLISKIDDMKYPKESGFVLVFTGIIAVVLFVICYRKKGLV